MKYLLRLKSTSNVRISLPIWAAMLAVLLGLSVANAQASGPALDITNQVAASPNTQVTVPMNLATNGSNISSIAFSVDLDENWLTLDSSDNNGDGIPDAVALSLPSGFIGSVSFDGSDTDGEIDVAIFSFSPSATLSDGQIAAITFDVGNPSTTTEAAVNFSLNPVASFGDPAGNDVPGTTDDGSVLIDVPVPPTVTPTPPPTSTGNVVIPLISAGELSVDWTGVIFPQTSLAGQDILAYAINETWTVSDTTQLGAGWHVTIMADDHLRGSQDPANRVINVGTSHDFQVECLDSDIAPAPGVASGGNLPTCAGGVQPIPNSSLGSTETPLTILSAATSNGLGAYGFVPRFQLLVPGTTIIDTYTTNIFVDVIAGP
ncbi:MAG: cohesin domain-containing protein [Ardenticatenaceae bacterium]